MASICCSSVCSAVTCLCALEVQGVHTASAFTCSQSMAPARDVRTKRSKTHLTASASLLAALPVSCTSLMGFLRTNATLCFDFLLSSAEVVALAEMAPLPTRSMLAPELAGLSMPAARLLPSPGGSTSRARSSSSISAGCASRSAMLGAIRALRPWLASASQYPGTRFGSSGIPPSASTIIGTGRSMLSGTRKSYVAYRAGSVLIVRSLGGKDGAGRGFWNRWRTSRSVFVFLDDILVAVASLTLAVAVMEGRREGHALTAAGQLFSDT